MTPSGQYNRTNPVQMWKTVSPMLDITALANRLDVAEMQLRRTGQGRVIAICGTRGTVRPLGDKIAVMMRDGIATGDVTRTLVDAGLFALDGDTLTIARLPDDSECRPMREMLGLHGGAGNGPWHGLMR